MNYVSEDQHIHSLKETIEGFVRELYITAECNDFQRLSELVTGDVFVFGSAFDAVSIGRDQFISDLRRQIEGVQITEIYIHSSGIQVGLCASQCSAWFFDRIVIDIVGDQKITLHIPI